MGWILREAFTCFVFCGVWHYTHHKIDQWLHSHYKPSQKVEQPTVGFGKVADVRATMFRGGGMKL